MFVVIQWIKKNLYPLFAILLFGFAFNQILRFQIYQHSFYFNSSISFLRTIDLWKSNFTSYFHLTEENESLKLENLKLRNQLFVNKSTNQIFKDTQYFDSISKSLPNYKVVYTYLRANVIKNSTNSRNNYFIIDQGSKQGIEPGMAVIGPLGIVGIIINCSDNYARGMSVLNSKFEITPYLPKLELRQGFISWQGNDAQYCDLKEVNRIEKVRPGMEVVTSNYSSIFPPNIPIGKIYSVSKQTKSNFHQLKIKLSTDFNRLNTIYCIKNNYQPEIDSLSTEIMNINHD